MMYTHFRFLHEKHASQRVARNFPKVIRWMCLCMHSLTKSNEFFSWLAIQVAKTNRLQQKMSRHKFKNINYLNDSLKSNENQHDRHTHRDTYKWTAINSVNEYWCWVGRCTQANVQAHFCSWVTPSTVVSNSNLSFIRKLLQFDCWELLLIEQSKQISSYNLWHVCRSRINIRTCSAYDLWPR